MDFDSFDITPGEHLAIVGPNGSGKTLLVDSLRRRHPFDIEYISFRDTYGDEADGAYYYQLRWNRQELANLVELESDAKDLFSLSSGELRKHRIARALESEAGFIIIDNPYLGLDAQSRVVFTESLSQIAREGSRTIILVMPSTNILPDFITRVVELGEADSAPKALPSDRRAAIEDLPVKDLSQVSFYPSGPDAEIVKCNRVSIRYDSITILDSLDWTVREGECWAVRGENGSGKSTLLSLVCADNPQAYACNIELFGHKRGSGESIWDIKRHIGYMSQKFSLYPDLKVWENIELFGGIYGLNDRQIAAKTDSMLKALSMENARDMYIRDMPLGWKQKLAFSIAMVHDPEIVFLDEPTGGVDPVTRRNFWEMIYETASRGVTVFVTTHYMDEAEYCDRVSVMVDGRIEALGSPAELKETYGAKDMDGVFTKIAGRAERGE